MEKRKEGKKWNEQRWIKILKEEKKGGERRDADAEEGRR